MDNKIFKGLVILFMTLSPLTTIVNAAPPAGKGNNKDDSGSSLSAFTGGVSTFIIDRDLEKIDITGTGLNTVPGGTGRARILIGDGHVNRRSLVGSAKISLSRPANRPSSLDGRKRIYKKGSGI